MKRRNGHAGNVYDVLLYVLHVYIAAWLFFCKCHLTDGLRPVCMKCRLAGVQRCASAFLLPAAEQESIMEERKPERISQKELQTILSYIQSIQYGSVHIVIQDGRIVQIERSEKIRFH